MDGVDSGQPATPPGWYPAADGRLWWWDGRQWLLPAPDRPVDPTLAVLPHLGFFVMPVIGAVVVLLTLGKRDELVRHHAAEAANAQIWIVGVWLVAWLGWGFLIVGIAAAGAEPSPIAILAVFGLLVAFLLAGCAASVVGAVQAHQRRFWRYPLIPYRFVHGARQSA